MRRFLILTVMVLVLGAACSSDDSSSTSSSKGSSSEKAASTSDDSPPTPVSLPGRTNNQGTENATSKTSVNVVMDDFFFSPTFIQVTPGEKLTLSLTNMGQNTHTFTSTALNINQTLEPGVSFNVEATVPAGTTEYHCTFHQSAGMQGAFFVAS